mmetsp:Transcript_8944/g.17101  ORF Transcript_8944/g.17101 Transcript_8944/m.17101 type:complete len:409 (+) Transcript_8944:1254-2480(+)
MSFQESNGPTVSLEIPRGNRQHRDNQRKTRDQKLVVPLRRRDVKDRGVASALACAVAGCVDRAAASIGKRPQCLSGPEIEEVTTLQARDCMFHLQLFRAFSRLCQLDQKAHHALEIDNLVIVFQVRRGDGCGQKAVAIFQRGQAAIDQFRGLLDEVSSVPEKSGSSVSCDTPSAGRVRNLQQGQPGPQENKSHRPQPSIAVCCVNADHLEQFGPGRRLLQDASVEQLQANTAAVHAPAVGLIKINRRPLIPADLHSSRKLEEVEGQRVQVLSQHGDRAFLHQHLQQQLQHFEQVLASAGGFAAGVGVLPDSNHNSQSSRTQAPAQVRPDLFVGPVTFQLAEDGFQQLEQQSLAGSERVVGGVQALEQTHFYHLSPAYEGVLNSLELDIDIPLPLGVLKDVSHLLFRYA